MPSVPEWPQFLRGCLRYRESLDRELPHAPRTTEELGDPLKPQPDAGITSTASILWRREDLPGHEIGTLAAFANGWQLSGTAVFLHEQRPCKFDYVVTCDVLWRTQSAHVSGVIGARAIDLDVSVDDERIWRVNGTEDAALEGCVDIDLGFSPSTNLLAIRRLALPVGGEADVKAAWLPFPSLRFEPLSQIYRREGEQTYRYESAGGSFVRTLEVNADGFVTNYPGLWEAESSDRPLTSAD